MTTALIVPFGADDSETGRARRAIWNRCYRLWTDTRGDGWQGAVLAEPHHLIVASDPLFGTPRDTYFDRLTDGPDFGGKAGPQHPFSVARAINRAVRHTPPEVDRFVCIGADALPDWRVVDWAAAELETRPWTLLFGKGGNVDARCTAAFAEHGHVPEDGKCYDVSKFETPCVGPIAFTRETFLAVRGFDERFEGWGYEDVDLWSRLRAKFNAVPFIYDEAKVSPYSLIQFSHPVDHHDLSTDNPNVRLWERKNRGGFLWNNHPAPHLLGADA